MTKEEPKVGVYICHCGGNISDTVNVEKVKKAAAQFKGVKIAETYEYVCSDPGQERITKGIKEHGLNRIVVASCSPLMHLDTFRRTVESAGLNPYFLEMANIREQCSWVHDDKEAGTAKAIDLIRGVVARARYLEPLEPKSMPVHQSVLIIGGGIAGIIASLELADKGYQVYLVERSPSIGGHMAQLSKTFPTLDCSQCILTPKMVDATRHPNIKIITMAEVTAVEGSPGNYRVLITKRPRFVNESKCTACGKCVDVCPVTMPSEFDVGLGTRKAIYKPFPQAIPPAFVIDKRGIPPCRAACPAGVNVQGYIALITQNKFKEALELIRSSNPFPAICGRVCFHPCEDKCERRTVDEPLAINALKRFVADYEFEEKKEKPAPIPKMHEEKVAIIGSGPAGLTAAYELVKKGYPVTVFESLPEPGGMLRIGIPEYRLPKKGLNSEIEHIKNLGVEIKTNITIGKDLVIDRLQKEYKAIFVAIGAQKSIKLGIEGEELKGVIHALDLLKEVNLGKTVKLGDRIAVIGGGNVAVDAARVALRLGSKEVFILYRRSRKEMPAFMSEVEQAEKEGAKIHFLVSPKKILGKNGKVVALECVRMMLGEPDATGRRQPIPIEGSEYTIELDTVIPAVGQSLDSSSLPEGIKVTRGNTIVADAVTLETSLPGIFAGGDAVLGAATVIEAIACGKRAAVSIDRYLRGQDLKADREEEIKTVKEVSKEGAEKKARQTMPLLPLDQRIGFKEVELGFTKEMAMEEANRCLFCGGCSECLECEKVCELEGVIIHQQKEETMELDIGAIVACTGFQQIDPEALQEYSFGLHPDIITNLQFERLLPQGLLRPSNGKTAKKVAFILCVGSRMMNKENGVEHCCKIGCMAAIKQAMLLQKVVPDAEPWIFYTDIRADGKGYEEFYATAQDHNVHFVRGRVAEVAPLGNDEILVRSEDTLLGTDIEGTFDLAVLSLGIIPNIGTKELAKKLGIQVGSDGFLLEKHYKLRPVDSQRKGMFVAGCALSPKDVRETTLEAMATASRVATFVGKGEISLSPEVAYIIPEKCDNCGVCMSVCPVVAVEKSPAGITINPVSCVGCGICVPRCPREAIDLNHCTEVQLLAQIRGVSEGGKIPKIIAFLEREIAYGSADLAGQTRASYSPNVEIIGVPSTGRIGLKHLLHAFASGADGVILLEDHGGVFTEEALREHVTQLKKELSAYGVQPLRLMSFTTTLPEYDKVLNTFETFNARISKIGPLSKETREKIREKFATT